MIGNGKHHLGGGHERAWLRITVVVASLGVCVGKALVWLHL